MKRSRPLLAALLGSLLALGAGTARAGEACNDLVRLAQPAGKAAFLPSFEGAPPGPLANAAFLYDNAVATIALIGCGRADLARPIGDAMLAALERDRFWHDGRLRNAYAAGSVGTGPLKLPGWWDDRLGRWIEDRYQVGSDLGNMAWAMLALLRLDETSQGDGRYLDAARRIGRWALSFADDRGPGGFKGGTFAHEPEPERLDWKSTEHNTDLAAAFAALAARSGGEAAFGTAAQRAEAFVLAMWQAEEGYFVTGTTPDGVSRNPVLALDAQIWPLLALAGAGGREAAILTVLERRLKVGEGYAYGGIGQGIWTEGTAQAALLFALLGRNEDAARALAAIAPLRGPTGGWKAANVAELPTGFVLQTDPAKPRLYFPLPHLGATAWVALAEQRFNPFTGKAALPGR